jgi:hypothetical protein
MMVKLPWSAYPGKGRLPERKVERTKGWMGGWIDQVSDLARSTLLAPRDVVLVRPSRLHVRFISASRQVSLTPIRYFYTAQN